ncbi:MAG: rhodanese-like domain-containing protein [Actinomycetota bacterium]
MAIPEYPGNFSAKAIEAPSTLAEEFVILDIREVNEWAAGHAPGSVNFPLSRIPSHVEDLPLGKVVLVCRNGNRSGTALDWLIQKGYRYWNLRDGMIGWKMAGFPIVRPNGTPGTLI